MSPLHFINYREFIRDRIRSFPRGGRGASLRLSEFLKVHPTHISQVLRGDRDLTRGQAWETARHFGLNEMEAEYFLLLVDIERAETITLRDYLEGRRDRMRQAVGSDFESQVRERRVE